MELITSFFRSFGFKRTEKIPKPYVPQLLLTFEEQVAKLKLLGFKINDGVEEYDLNRWGGLHEFEYSPFELLYRTLGQKMQREPWLPVCDRCWDLETDSVEGSGSYIRILHNLQRISRGELCFSNLEDYVNLEEKQAWVSFEVNGDYYKWNLEVDDDWIDPDIFSNVVALTYRYSTYGKFTYYSSGGQNVVVGYETAVALEKLKAVTGLGIEWLS